MRRYSLFISLLLVSGSIGKASDVIPLSQAQAYVERFNADDREVFAEAFPNARAWEFLSANIPLLDCPDKELERTYYFRWWTFRKHLKQVPEGWVITEFLSKVSWSASNNTINCAAAHHVREGRWLKDRKFVDEYLDYWLRKGGRVHAYSFWVADSVLAWCDVAGDYQPAKTWLPMLIKNYESWEKSNLDPVTGMFWQWDGSEGMEGSVGGAGFRPTINSYMYGDALAIARIAEMSGQPDVARTYREKAEKIKQLVQARLWNEEQQFFEIRRSPWGLAILRWWINNDTALTQSAKITASAPGSAGILKDARVPARPSDLAAGSFNFARRMGTEEWVQYELPAPVELSSCQLYFMNAGMFLPPASFQVFYRLNGEWKKVPEAREENPKFSRWNTIVFKPVRTEALRIELKLMGSDRNGAPLSGVRELIGYVPWYFDLPDERFGVAWKQLVDPKGFSAPFGLTTAEQRHPGFGIRYDRHECLWDGPVWPFATAQTLTALANHLNRSGQPALTRADYLKALQTYAHSQRLTLSDGKVVPWIDEDQNPYTGDWIARTCILNWEKKDLKKWKAHGGTSDRGKDYNHSTFCDLVINGLIGVRPQPDDSVVVNPLVPEGAWDYFCLDRVPYHGRMLTVLWDRTGTRYGKGMGLRVFADGREIAQSQALSRVVGKLQPETPRINGAPVFGVRPGSPCLYSIPATGERPMTFAVEGLPEGLSLDSASGRITGRLVKAGKYQVVLVARNAQGEARRPFQIIVGEAISLTPPMGWNSWNCWAAAVDQDKVLRAAKALVASGLDQHGWTYINIDDAWQGKRGGKYNAIQPNAKFPDIKGLADAIHGMGLKFGIYSTPWRGSYAGWAGSSCDRADGVYDWMENGGCNEFLRLDGKDLKQVGSLRKANWVHGAVPFFDQDARQWAEWGVDFLKYDWRPIDLPHAEAMRKALRATGRDIVYSLSNAAAFTNATAWGGVANLWRTTGDIVDKWKSISGIGFGQDRWAPFQAPGHYNDPDMLVVGKLGWGKPRPNNLTPDEQYTHISLWCLLSAPLLLGCDLEQLDSFTLGLLTNDEVLALDQDELVKPARCVATEGAAKVYVKELADGSKAVGLFNTGTEGATVTLKWEDAGLKGRQRLRDLWRQMDVGTFDASYTVEVPSHGVVLIKAFPAN